MGFQPEIPERDYRPIHPEPAWRSLARKIWAPLAVVLGLIVKFGFAFAKFASIFVAVGGYALIWGWQFAVGFVLLIFVHELGHFVEARRRGFNAAWPVFIPFLGAYVAIRDARMNPWQNFWISFAGPFWGSVGAASVWLVGEQQGSRLLQALGYVGFLLNLFNMVADRDPRRRLDLALDQDDAPRRHAGQGAARDGRLRRPRRAARDRHVRRPRAAAPPLASAWPSTAASSSTTTATSRSTSS